MEKGSLVDEVKAAILQAAGGQTVTRIRLRVGRQVSVPRTEIAMSLHRSFPHASIDMEDGKESDAVVVRDIEVG